MEQPYRCKMKIALSMVNRRLIHVKTDNSKFFNLFDAVFTINNSRDLLINSFHTSEFFLDGYMQTSLQLFSISQEEQRCKSPEKKETFACIK